MPMLTTRSTFIIILVFLMACYGITFHRTQESMETSPRKVLLYSIAGFIVTLSLQYFVREDVAGYCIPLTLGYASLLVFSALFGGFPGYASGIGLGVATAMINCSYRTAGTMVTASVAGALTGWLCYRYRETSSVIMASMAGGAIVFGGECAMVYVTGHTNVLMCMAPLATSLITGLIAAASVAYLGLGHS